MAPTKRKRQTKHRGNAAGVVESRGRTGRKPTAGEKSGDPRKLERERARERERKMDKRDLPPTWRSAFIKAMLASIALLFVFVVLLHQSNGAVAIFPVLLIFYTVFSYYTDKFVYERRQRKKAREAGGGGAASR
jgi:Flp pilus assembly protein TadB